MAYSMWSQRARRKYDKKSCKIVGWLWEEPFTAPCLMKK